MKEYKIKKKEFKKQDIEFMRIFFDNGDYLQISKTEILDISVRLYDQLIWENKSLCPVAESGYIKLNLLKKSKGEYTNAFLYDLKDYKKDRIAYIKHRLCEEGGIKYIMVFDDLNWYNSIFGSIKAELDEDNVIIRFMPKAIKEPYLSENNIVKLNDVNKSLIESIDLDFENCEVVTIYNDEIKDINLNLCEELCWGSGDYVRQVKSGYLVLKLNPENNEWRKNSFFDKLPKGKKGNKKIESRLCGKNGFCDHDLCHLYIDYDHAGFGPSREECLEIEDIRREEDFEKILKCEDENEQCYYPCFIGGFAEKQNDGTILITFGTTATKNEKMQQLLKKYEDKIS